MSARIRRWCSPLRCLILLACAVAFIRFVTWPAAPFRVRFRQGEMHRVARVVDGDTLELTNGDRVRLIGIDTPEIGRDGRPDEPLARAAGAFTDSLVEGRTVRLTYDRERYDRYRRVLAWVHVDGRLVNEQIVRRGLARVLTRFTYRTAIKKRLLAAQSDAQRAQLGIWSSP